MAHERPHPRVEILDARLRDLPGTSLHPILAAVSEIDAFLGWWRGRFLSPPAYLAPLREKAIASARAASDRIDWSGLPARSPRRLRPPEPPRAAADRYTRCVRQVFDRFGEMTPGPELLCALHAALCGGGNRPGTARPWRTVPDPPVAFPHRGLDAAILRSEDPARIPESVEVMFEWAGSRLAERRFHPLLTIAAFALEFLAIRPFADGNVRLSRLLSQLYLLRSGYAWIAYSSLDAAIADRKAEYYIALRKAQGTLSRPRADLTPWLREFLSALRRQAGNLAATLGPLPPAARLSANQAEVLRLLARDGEVSVRLVVRELGIPRETAKQVLSRLARLGALERAGAGRAARYLALRAPAQEPQAAEVPRRPLPLL